MGVFTVLEKSGDDSIVWDADDPNQVKDAKKQFKEFIDAGYKIFTVGKKGKQTIAKEFDAKTEEFLVVKTTKKG